MPSPGGRAAPGRPAPGGAGRSRSIPARSRAGSIPWWPRRILSSNVIPQLRVSAQHPNPAGLRDRLAQGVREFEARARTAGAPTEKIVAARYAVCTLIDETAASTPWGASGAWAQQGLLALFHGETGGGEKFFQVLARLAENPQANVDVLELMYVCLQLGFEGRYRIVDGGPAPARGDPATAPGDHPQGARRVRARPVRELAGRARGGPDTARLAAALGGRGGHGAAPGRHLRRLQVEPEHARPTRWPCRSRACAWPPRPRPGRPRNHGAEPRLAPLLADEIKRGLVTVDDRPDRSIVTVLGGGLFKPGEAAVSGEGQWLLTRIAEALDEGAWSGRGDRSHGQRADSHPALPVELGAVQGTRGVGGEAPGGPCGRRPRRVRRARRDRTPRVQRHARGPGAKPSRGDHPLRAGRRYAGHGSRRGPSQAMRRLVRLIFNRWVLIAIGLAVVAVLIWWVGPTISISNVYPFEAEWVRWLQIAVLFLTPVVRVSWRFVSARRASAALATALVKPETRIDPSAGEVAQLRQRFESAVDMLRKRSLGSEKPSLWARLRSLGSQQYLYDLPWYVFIGAPGRWQDHGARQLRAALPARGPSRPRCRPWRGGHPGLRLVVHGRGRVPGHGGAIHDPAEQPGRRCRGLEGLPPAAQEVSLAPADQRGPGHGQRGRPPAAVAGRAGGADRRRSGRGCGSSTKSSACAFRSTCW